MKTKKLAEKIVIIKHATKAKAAKKIKVKAKAVTKAKTKEIFARYKEHTFKAILNLKDFTVLYRNKIMSPTISAETAVKTFKKDPSINGWLFWRFTDNGVEKKITELR